LQPVHRNKIILAFFFAISVLTAYAQPNQEQYDNKWMHFGFSLTANIASARVDTKSDYLKTDTLMNVRQTSYPGIGLGAIVNFRLGEYFDIRLLCPAVSFVQRNLTYEFPTVKKQVKIESAYCDASLLLKFKSARRKNMRLYVIGGMRASYDLSSTTGKNRSNEEPVVSLIPFTYGYEAGFGFDFYFPYFKFSPELKVCNTINNAMYRDGFIYTNALERISPKMVVFSLHFE
jgi:hypothetical protein